VNLSWPTEGARHANAAAFVALVAEHDGFWGADFALKYLGVQIDTRGGWFILSDRDGNRIHPDRVVKAIAQWREWHPRPAESGAQGSERSDEGNLPPDAPIPNPNRVTKP
jgi:hypothetical protein